ncbi:MAG: 6-phosphogluconate dehydrogenase [Crocinitomicaceae bacterium]
MSEEALETPVIQEVSPFKKKVKKAFRNFLIYSGIGLVLFIILYFLYTNYTFSEGTRTGYLIKTSRKGYIFKTYEGQLNLGGFGTDKSTGLIGNIWNFSIDDVEMYQKIQSFEGEKVTVSYKEINNAMPWQGETNYFVYDIKVKK